MNEFSKTQIRVAPEGRLCGEQSNVDIIQADDQRFQTLARFSAAWGAGDVDGLLQLMSDEPVYKGSTGPCPGTVYVGRDNVRRAFERMVGRAHNQAEGSDATAAPPEAYFFGDRALVFWCLALPDADGSLSDVEGVDVITFTEDGRIAVKDAYRKAFP